MPTRAEEFSYPAKSLPNFLKYPLSLPGVKKMAYRIKPDLVNAHFVPNYGLLGAWLRLQPLVISTWGSDVLVSPRKSWLHKLRAEYVLKRADLVTADASISARALYKLGVETEKVLTCPMGVEKNSIGQCQKREKPYLLVMSNRKLESLYDVATLLRAIPLVTQQVKKDVKFVIIGEGSQKSHLLNMAIRLKIEAQVEFRGIVSRQMLTKCYRDSDIYVSTALSDSTSVSLLEAMNFGLVPIVTDIPGNREWIEEEKNGFLFPGCDHKALAEKMVYLINQFTYWTDFRDRNQAIVRGRAVWEDNMGLIQDRFRELVSLSGNSTQI